MFREKHPHAYVLNALRASARKRKLPFTITLAQFKEFCAKTGYMELRGHGAGFYTVDRIDSNKGYHANNIRILEFLANCEGGADNTPRNERGAEQTVPEDNEPF